MTHRELLYELEITGLDTSSMSVGGFVGREALSDTYRFVITLFANEDVAIEPLLGKDATIWIRFGNDDPPRAFHGVVMEGSTEAVLWDTFEVRFEIAARAELMKLGKSSLIVQEKSVQQAVEQVLGAAGFPVPFAWEAKKDLEARENIVQYNESNFAFITRLLYEEGINFAITNAEAKDKLFIFDKSSILTPIDGVAALQDRDATQLDLNIVWELASYRVASSDAVMLRDYDLKDPGGDLDSKEATDDTTGREVYIHPGNYVKKTPVGKRMAERTLDRLRAGTTVMTGRSDCPYLEPGRTVAIQSHPRSDLNIDLIIVSVIHRATVEDRGDGSVFSYENEFTAIPATVEYRPQVSPPVPVIGGVQLAFVTCAPNEEIHTEDFGRSKVRFPWDRSGLTDDKSSTWLRVGQLPLSGSMVLPRIDFEVIVDFEMGDIDRPFISGHLYNTDKAPPYELPAGKTRTSFQTATTDGGAGANELRFEDSAGAEEVFLNASKDLTMSVENDTTFAVKTNETFKVGSNNTLSVTQNHFANVTGNRTLDITGNQEVNVTGEMSDGVGGALDVDITGNRMVKVGLDHSENVKGNLTRTVSILQSVTGLASYSRKVVGNSKVDVTAAWAELAGKSRMVSVGTLFTETVGALKFIKAKQMSVSCGLGYTMTAAAETVDCGGSRNDSAKGAVTVKAGGAMTIKAADIVIAATVKLTLKGGDCSIELAAPGSVLIKGPTVILKGAKAFNQAMYENN